MRKQIEAAFSQCAKNDCYTTLLNESIYIADTEDKQPCSIVVTEDQAHLVVQNPSKKAIYFLKIDQCLFFDDSEHKKCDCAVFDEAVFCFVEIKNTVRAKQRQKHRRKAREQLATTIELFQTQLDLSTYQQKAIVCFTFKPARPLASTRAQEAAILFQDQYNVTLLEGNKLIL